MSTTADLFARWKAAKGYTSERQALKALRLSPGAAVHWKAGRNADADVIEKMAKDLGENAYALVAQAMAEQAKGPAARTWTRIAKRLAATAITLLPVVSGVAQDDLSRSGDARAMYYAKWPLWLRMLCLWIGSRFEWSSGSSIEARTV